MLWQNILHEASVKFRLDCFMHRITMLIHYWSWHRFNICFKLLTLLQHLYHIVQSVADSLLLDQNLLLIILDALHCLSHKLLLLNYAVECLQNF